MAARRDQTRRWLDLWLKQIAPSAGLRKWFGHDAERWQEFRHRYRAALARNEPAVAQLLALLSKGPVTPLYGARDVERNQAVVLLDYMSERKASAP